MGGFLERGHLEEEVPTATATRSGKCPPQKQAFWEIDKLEGRWGEGQAEFCSFPDLAFSDTHPPFKVARVLLGKPGPSWKGGRGIFGCQAAGQETARGWSGSSPP